MQNAYVDEVQSLIQQLAARLRQSVAIDDEAGNLIAVSRHYGDADDYRVRLILERRAPPKYRDFFRSFTSETLTTPFRIPEEPTLRLAPRICYPIHKNSRSFAFLWLIDRGADLPEDVIMSFCGRLADLLYERRPGSAETDEDKAKTHLIERLLRGEDEGRSFDAGSAAGLIASEEQYLVAACYLPAAPDKLRSEAKHTLRDLPGLVPDLGLELECLCVIGESVVAAYGDATTEHGQQAATEHRLANEVGALIVRRSSTLRCGLSTSGDARALRDLFVRAALASFLCREFFRDETMVAWRDVSGLGRMIQSEPLVGGTLGLSVLRDLLQDEADFTFATLGAMLHSGREEGSPSEILQIHRTTLYYRLQQIEKRTGLDLQKPKDRFLATSLWLQVAYGSSSLSDLPITP